MLLIKYNNKTITYLRIQGFIDYQKGSLYYSMSKKRIKVVFLKIIEINGYPC